LAIAPHPYDQGAILHRATCPGVRMQAMLGEPVATMLGCESIPDDIDWHSCLDDERG
jgi:hypothetical protein